MAIRNRNIKAPAIAADAIDISKINLEADPNATLGVMANRYLQLPTLATGELVAADTAGNGVLVYDTTANALKGSINGAYVSLGVDFSSARAYINFGISGALGAATAYMGPGIEAIGEISTTEDNFFIAPTAGTLTKMYCNLGTAPGGADTVVYTVRIGGVDKTITATISAAGTTANDTAHTEAVAAGEKVSIKSVSSAATAANTSVTLEFVTKTN